jgi:hypothetical protein
MDSIRFFIHEEEEVAGWVLADFIYFTSNKSTSILLYINRSYVLGLSLFSHWEMRESEIPGM